MCTNAMEVGFVTWVSKNGSLLMEILFNGVGLLDLMVRCGTFQQGKHWSSRSKWAITTHHSRVHHAPCMDTALGGHILPLMLPPN
jgi:hypothetical protein